MKKILLPMLFFCLSTAVFSQENKTELTEAQKDELRKKHNSSLNFSSSKNTSQNQLKTTNTTEEKNVKTTTVTYYHGTQDSTYKQMKYIKPD